MNCGSFAITNLMNDKVHCGEGPSPAEMSMDNRESINPKIPARIEGLGELATNLWWSWNPRARDLFNMLNPAAWQLSVHNPVKLLHDLEGEVLEEAATNPRFLRHYDSVIGRFRSEMRNFGGWFPDNVNNPGRLPVAYFSAEYGLHHSMPFYAGGLGFLAGDFLKESSDLGLPMIGVGFMYPGGYLRQRITSDGWQTNESEELHKSHAPITRMNDETGKPLVIQVPLIEPPIFAGVWRLKIGRVSLFLLDTDVEENDPWNREISSRLYVGDAEHRLRQELVLGIGGTAALARMGYGRLVLHLNEGHPAFAIIERIRQLMEAGLSFTGASGQVRNTTVFTTHTPVLAGHDVFAFSLLEKYFGSYLSSIGLDQEAFFQMGTDPARPDAGFNMTVLAMRMSRFHNCVSRRHMEVTEGMWGHLRQNGSPEPFLDYITNGIHLPTWINPRLESLFNRYLGPGWLSDHDDPTIWELVDEIPDGELWAAHRLSKMKLITHVRERARQRWTLDQPDPGIVLLSGVFLDPMVLTIGFARRFATYKRATLILSDTKRLCRILNNCDRPVQLVFSGKAHPQDYAGKEVIQQIYRAAKDSAFGGRIVFVEDYDEQLAQYLIPGVDLWLNNPLPPMEACGTSGMKAGINGVPQLSILDGWWIEGFNGFNGWAFSGGLGDDRDARDASQIYDILENQVVPRYYAIDNGDGVAHGWISVMKEAIKSAGPQFCTRRMVKEYASRFYQEGLKEAERLPL
ncbi:MAG: Carbohydrate phosphorylase [Methanosaeta sp. PtaB.Bin039]|nr:MAG: Carbohydrate phosphorylase [Methanosaeta sp. PtaB.Bin039]